jgi:hypothetical protein
MVFISVLGGCLARRDLGGDLGVELPEVAAELAGDGDDDFVAVQAAGGEALEAIV